MKKDNKYLTIKDYAVYKGVTRQTVYNWLKNQALIKNRDYLIISDESTVIILNEFTK